MVTKEMLDAEIGRLMDAFPKATGDHLYYMYGRWQDEKQYEDWADYDKAIRKAVEGLPFTVTATTKRPFGFKFTTDIVTGSLGFIVKGNYVTIRWKCGPKKA